MSAKGTSPCQSADSGVDPLMFARGRVGAESVWVGDDGGLREECVQSCSGVLGGDGGGGAAGQRRVGPGHHRRREGLSSPRPGPVRASGCRLLCFLAAY